MIKFVLLAIFLSVSSANASDFIEVKKESGVVPKGAKNICKRYDWFCSIIDGKETNLDTVKRINREINRANPIEDIDQYGEIEKWSLLSNKGGDCEDYALTKKKALIELGYSSNALFIGMAKLKDGTPHAFLVWRTSEGDFILDNLTNHIVKWNRTGYDFIAIQDPNNKRKWLITK